MGPRSLLSNYCNVDVGVMLACLAERFLCLVGCILGSRKKERTVAAAKTVVILREGMTVNGYMGRKGRGVVS
jgi:hypothetical protein